MNPPDWLVALLNTIAGSAMFWTGFWITVVAIFFLILYRERIGAFIGQRHKVGAGKWAAEAEAQMPEQKISPPVATPLAESGAGKSEKNGKDAKSDPRAAADDLLAAIPTTPYIRSREDMLKKTLAERGLDAASPETYRVLTAYTALAFVVSEREKIYSTIWTSQIEILKEANTHEVTDEELKEIYETGAAGAPALYARHLFPAYLAFLTSQELLVKMPSGNHTITLKGRMFLTYLVNEGRGLTGRAP